MPRVPLIVRFVLALAAMGLLPLGISYFQLASQYDVLVEQVQRSHQLAAGTAARRLDATLERHLALARATAEHPAAIEGDPTSRALGELLTGSLAAQEGVVALGIFDAVGERVMLAKPRDRDLEAEIGSIFGPVPATGAPETAGEASVELIEGTRGRVLRVRQPIRGASGGFVVLVAAADELAAMLDAPELGPSFRMLLAAPAEAPATAGAEAPEGRAARVLVGGDPGALDELPTESLEQAASGKLATGARVYRDASGESEEIVVGHARLDVAPWFVLSRQPAADAEAARRRMERVTLQATGLALALTLLLSGLAFTSVVQPLRRLAAQQRELVGGGAGGGSEIEELERSFDLLKQRIRDSEDLGQIFLGRYQVTDLVGSGAMGSVFRGWDDKLRRAVALKTVHLDSEDVDREKLLASLRDEAAITARIHQANIVTVYDIEDRGTTAFIAMEYVEGTNLRQVLELRRRLPPLDAVALGAGIARGLAAAHSNYLVHHDVKPGNILLGLDGSVKLTDFGVSQSITAATQKKDVICGTPGYLPPECFEGDDYTPASDLWALGVVLWEAVAGRHPFRSRTLRQTIARTLSYQPQPLADLVPETPVAFSEIVAELLDPDPNRRPEDGVVLSRRLDALAGELGAVWVGDLSDVLAAKERDTKDGATVSVAGVPPIEPTQLLSRSR